MSKSVSDRPLGSMGCSESNTSGNDLVCARSWSQVCLKRQSFCKKYFENDKNFFPWMVESISTWSINDWATLLVCSENMHKHFGSRDLISSLEQSDYQDMREFLIEEPLTKLYWKERIPAIINDYCRQTTSTSEIVWPNPFAVLVCLTMRRIVGYEAPNFEEIKLYLLSECNREYQYPKKIMKKVSSKYNLQYAKLSSKEVSLTIFNGRPCLAVLTLTREQTQNLAAFFAEQSNSKEIITSSKLDRHCAPELLGSDNLDLHYVILLNSFESHYLFMRCNRSQWGDEGKFMVEKKALPHVAFYDLFWYEADVGRLLQNLYETRLKAATEKFIKIIDLIEHKKNQEDQQADFLRSSEDFYRTMQPSLLRVLENRGVSLETDSPQSNSGNNSHQNPPAEDTGLHADMGNGNDRSGISCPIRAGLISDVIEQLHELCRGFWTQNG